MAAQLRLALLGTQPLLLPKKPWILGAQPQATPTMEVLGHLPLRGLQGHLGVCPLEEQPSAVGVVAVAQGVEGSLHGDERQSHA